MRHKPFSWAFSAFLNGQWDRLFGTYSEDSRVDALVEALDRKEAHRAELKKCVRLVAGNPGKPQWVELVPQSTRQGVVTASNLVEPGTVVRSRIPWSHAIRPRAPGSAITTGDPRWLQVVSMPAPQRVRKGAA
jgi:hypothetical protein